MGAMECGMKLGVVAGGESVLGVGVGVGVGVGLYGGTFFYDILPNFSYWGLEFLLPTLPQAISCVLVRSYASFLL